jgi:CheY-like chemotaxis protein
MPNFGYHILLVEDDLIIQKVTAKFLDILGCSWVIASNGKEGFHEAMSGSFDLILMDIMMPVMDGIQASEKILSAKGDAAPPIVVLSAYDVPETRRRCAEVGIHDFVTKPITIDKLKQIFERGIGKA